MKIINLMKRHFKIYLHNPMNILISMLSVVVILSLYFLFIRDFTIKAVIDYGFHSPNNSLFVDQLMIFGLLIVISTTAILPICNIFVKDCENGIIRDFLIAPISKIKVIYSYILVASFISICITFLTYLLMNIYLFYCYTIGISWIIIVNSFLVIVFSTLLAANIIFLISFFIKTCVSFSNFGNLLGVTIGFFTGVYIPIGYYPEIIRTLFFYFPLCQTTSLLRNINAEKTLQSILLLYPEDTHFILKETFGLTLTMNGNSFSIEWQLQFLLVQLLLTTLIIFFVTKYKKNWR